MDIRTLQQMIKESNDIVFLGGAGVSTESGLPDFRGEGGLYEAREAFPPEYLLSHSCFIDHTDRFYAFYQKHLLRQDIQPNAAHKKLAQLESMGKLSAVITQNIDGLHQMAGSKNVWELHGSVHRNFCMACGRSFDLAFMKNSAGVPHCPCGGIVKPDIVLYGEPLDDGTLKGAVHAIERADILIVGGTSLSVYPAAGLLDAYRGHRLVLINLSPTPFDGRANLLIRNRIGRTLERITLHA